MSDDLPEGVVSRRSYDREPRLENDSGKVEIEGDYTPLTDEQIARLIGIDDNGEINRRVLAQALRDLATNSPALYALFTADVV